MGVQNLDSILNSPIIENIDLVVIGRLDLSLSMGYKDVDNLKVSKVTQEIVKKVNQKGLPISIGGFVNPYSANRIINSFRINRLNLIHLLFDFDKVEDVSKSIEKGILFEIKLFEEMKKVSPHRVDFYNERIRISKNKLKMDTNDKSITFVAESETIQVL